MTKLSPAAQAVLDAALPHVVHRYSVAAALRAAAIHLRSDEYETCGGASYSLMIDVDDLLAIADELEAQ